MVTVNAVRCDDQGEGKIPHGRIPRHWCDLVTVFVDRSAFLVSMREKVENQAKWINLDVPEYKLDVQDTNLATNNFQGHDLSQ